MVRKIGAFVGKFAPPHIGHINQISDCAKQVDELRVVVAENPENIKTLCLQSGLPYMEKNLRIGWLKEIFKNSKNIKILYMNETGIESSPPDMKKWAERFKQIVGSDVNVKFADESYRELNEKYFPECEFKSFDRTVINISATKIRFEPEKYLDYLIDPVKSYFEEIIKEKEIKKLKKF